MLTILPDFSEHTRNLLMAGKYKYGVRGHDLGKQDPLQAGPFLKSQGYDCAMVVFHKLLNGLNSYDDMLSEKLLSEVKAGFDKAGFTPALVGCYQDLANPECEQYNLAVYERLAQASKAVGARYLGSETAFVAISDAEIEARRSQLLKMVPEICRRIARYGIGLLLEPVGRQPLHTPELCRELALAVQADSLRFVFDAANIVRDAEVKEQRQLWDHWFSVTEFTERVTMIHFKDFAYDSNGGRVMCELGKGVIDWDYLSVKFRQLPALEYVMREWQKPALVQTELAFMRRCMNDL